MRKDATVITTGNKRLRCGVYMGAISIASRDHESKALYERLLAKGKPKKVAIVAVMNKLLRRVAAVVNRGSEFVPA